MYIPFRKIFTNEEAYRNAVYLYIVNPSFASNVDKLWYKYCIWDIVWEELKESMMMLLKRNVVDQFKEPQ